MMPSSQPADDAVTQSGPGRGATTTPAPTQPTTETTTAMPGVSRLIAVASKEFPRYSEADVIELADGRLLLAVARKKSGSDFAPGEIIGRFSLDRGVSWDDEPHVIQA